MKRNRGNVARGECTRARVAAELPSSQPEGNFGLGSSLLLLSKKCFEIDRKQYEYVDEKRREKHGKEKKNREFEETTRQVQATSCTLVGLGPQADCLSGSNSMLTSVINLFCNL